MTISENVASSFAFIERHIRHSSTSDIFWYVGADLSFGASFDSGRHNLVNIP